MVQRAKDLWSLVLHQQHIDPSELAEAIEVQALHPPLDYRTRLLIRDGVDALERRWPKGEFDEWFASSPARKTLDSIRTEHFDRIGFPYLSSQLMEPTRPETILQMLR